MFRYSPKSIEYKDLINKNKTLEKCLEISREANRFYSDASNWWWQINDSNKTAYVIDSIDICYSDWDDGCAGTKAREAESKINEILKGGEDDK